jgi:hypothetical protein
MLNPTALAKGKKLKAKSCFSLTFLTTPENLDYYPLSMHASRFTFAFTYRYHFTGSGHADLC